MDLLFPEDLISNLGVPQLIDIRDQLPVNPNYTWSQLAGVRPLEDLTTIALHHDAISKSSTAGTSDLQLAINIAKSHIRLTKNEAKGDAGFPYHVWIRNGKAYWANNVLDRTYGVASNNGYTVHVCVSGDYANGDTLTEDDRRLLTAVCVDISKQLPNYKGIKAHSELNPTDCPGYDYQRIRADVASYDQMVQARYVARVTAAYNTVIRFQDLYNKAKDPAFQFKDVALSKLEDIASYMVQKDYMNP